MFTELFDKYFLCHFNDSVKEEDLPNEWLKKLYRCAWLPQDLENLIQSWVNSEEQPLNTNEEGWKMLTEVITMTLMFVQYNFTGPFNQLAEYEDILASKSDELKSCEPFKNLKVNGEEINPNVKLGELLVMAKRMHKKLLDKWPESLYLNWWLLRLTCLHQKILDELTTDLYRDVLTACDMMLSDIDLLKDPDLEVMLHLEVANSHLLFHRADRSAEALDEMCAEYDVELRVEGLLGMRTKFQKNPLPQLCLRVVQRKNMGLPPAAQSNGSTNIPKLLLLDDDTRLERIRFIDPKANEIMTLPSVLQALVLAKVKELKRSQPKDRLADEQLEPYTQTLLYQEFGPLPIRQSALLLNCLQESTQRRTVERSWKQCEEVVKMLENDAKYTVRERLSYFFVGFPEPKWQVQMQLCELLISLGLTKTALDIYMQIQAWPEVIDCYTRLELRHKAAEVIRQELEKKPTVLLHCMLGDATDDPTCYETAWEFSKHTSGRAQACWGSYFFHRREYEEALNHLELSVEINSLQEKAWLRLGYAAMATERWAMAAHAYITYTHLEPLGFEAWNNLAKSLIKLGNKNRAHRVLGEALKCNFDNWKVWENFMVVSVDTGHFEDAMNAYMRLDELKDRYLDLEVLSITINALANGTPDARGQSRERLLKKATNLMGHQCVKHPNEPKVWELAALIAATPLSKSLKLLKASRAYLAKEVGWATKQECALKALQLNRDMCVQSLAAIDEHSDHETPAVITSQLNSARLSAQGCVRAVEKDGQKWEDSAGLLAELKELVERLTAKAKERIAS